jgi:hypothetical protein
MKHWPRICKSPRILLKVLGIVLLLGLVAFAVKQFYDVCLYHSVVGSIDAGQFERAYVSLSSVCDDVNSYPGFRAMSHASESPDFVAFALRRWAEEPEHFPEWGYRFLMRAMFKQTTDRSRLREVLDKVEEWLAHQPRSENVTCGLRKTDVLRKCLTRAEQREKRQKAKGIKR